MSALEDLIVENQKTYSQDLMIARSRLPDGQATADFKTDEEKMAKLAEVAGVKPEDIVGVAVRGTNVTFMVKDAQTAVSAGFLPLAQLEDAEEGDATVQPRTDIDMPLHGGAATVPTVVTEPEPPPGDPLAGGVPANIDNLTGDAVARLLKDTPDGVDRDAVLRHEFDREGGPRTNVVRAAKTTGMLDAEGQPRASDEGEDDEDDDDRPPPAPPLA
jgi:hypothetical protein